MIDHEKNQTKPPTGSSDSSAGNCVLIVEDDPESAKLLTRILSPAYQIHQAWTAQEALGKLASYNYNLVLLDVVLPGTSGLELCEKVKSDFKLRHIPIILITGMASIEDKIHGLRIGADDFIPKPYNADELLARVEAVIRRSSLNLEANPLTHLPGNNTIETEIQNRLALGKIFSVLYIDIDHFKAYNDYYGFYRGDWVLIRMADILLEASAGPYQLIGHLGGDDFVVVVGEENPAILAEKIILAFNGCMPVFYDPEDLRAGSILTRDRNNEERTFPFISLSIGIVTNKTRSLSTLGEVATIGAELKKFAKQHVGSFYALDRRSGSSSPLSVDSTTKKKGRTPM